MKNLFTQPTFRGNESRVLLLITAILLLFNTLLIGKKNDVDEGNRKLLSPPTPTVVVLTLPLGVNCYSSLTASGCNAGNTVIWYQNGNSFYATGATITASSSTPLYLTARCYDGGIGTFGTASAEYKALSATYAELTPGYTQTLCAGVTSILFNASSAFSGLTYQWKHNNSNISSVTNSSYTATSTGY